MLQPILCPKCQSNETEILDDPFQDEGLICYSAECEGEVYEISDILEILLAEPEDEELTLIEMQTNQKFGFLFINAKHWST